MALTFKITGPYNTVELTPRELVAFKSIISFAYDSPIIENKELGHKLTSFIRVQELDWKQEKI